MVTFYNNYLVYISLILLVNLFSSPLFSQDCLESAWVNIALIGDSEAIRTEFEVDICAKVLDNTEIKTIIFRLEYDVDKNESLDSLVEFSINNNGIFLKPGEHCVAQRNNPPFKIFMPYNGLMRFTVIADGPNGVVCSLISSYQNAVETQREVLPVELGSFSGYKKGREIQLDWMTYSEEAFSHFEIEKMSEYDRTFVQIGKIEGLGESASELFYSFIDREPSLENYYRLKMVDLDGSFEYSKTINIKYETGNELSSVNVFPNPSQKENIWVNFEMGNEGQATFIIFDVTGKKVLSFKRNLQPGVQNIPLDISNLKSGNYTLFTQTEHLFHSEKLMVLNLE